MPRSSPRKMAEKSGAVKQTSKTRTKVIPKKDEDSESNVSQSDEDQQEYDSDALDGSEDEAKTKKRKRVFSSPKKTTRSPRKKQKASESEEDDFDLKDGQEIVGVVVQAPKTGRVPPGQISQNTLDFLAQLQDPECNDREWFKVHEPVYRLAETEWKDFVEAVTDVLNGVDSQIPHLPPKDVIHRIYRDIRFSNDKTPYKKNLSASFSRSGRKGIFAGYHISLQAGNQTFIAAGTWCAGKNELATIRANIQRSSDRLKRTISDPEFVKFFGEPKPHPKGERRNIFGRDDELKVAPKGVPKDHEDIALLKCRSFAVSHKFMDSEVLEPDFKDKLASVARVLRPFVHCLNDMMTLPTAQDDNDDDDSGDEDEAEE